MARSPSESRVVMTQIVMPVHTNRTGSVMFGGVVMQWIDMCAGVAAMKHARGPVVTASIDRLDFLTPIHLGEVVLLQAQVNFAARTSLEVGVRVETEDPRTGARRYTTKAYLTFVAVDDEGRPRPIEEIVPGDADELRRFASAEARRQARLAARAQPK
jgi:acyl-CoA hydrolase